MTVPTGEPVVSGGGDEQAQAQADADVAAELARVRAERDALAAKLDRRAKREAQGGRIRKAFVVFLVALSILLIPLTATITWAHQTVFNTDRWVQTVGPIAKDPVVISAVSARVTDEIFTAVDPEQKIKDALTQLQQQFPKVPSALVNMLAGPAADQVKNLLNEGVNKALSTEQFQTFWVNANRTLQQQVDKVLHGESTAIQTVNGMVVLNMVPLLNSALQQVQGTISSITGKNITIPTISGDELPSVVCEKISTALGRPLPTTCGQIPLFPADKLDAAQQLTAKFDRWFVGLLILTPLLIIGAIALSKRRRRTALQIAIGGVLGLVVVRRLTMYLEGKIEGKAQNPAAANAIVSQVLHLFFNLTLLLAIIGLVVMVVLLLTGPYRWAVAMRSGIRRGAIWIGRVTVAVTRSLAGHTRDVAGRTQERARDEATLDWIREHRGALQIGGVAVAFVLLLWVSLSPLSLLIIAVLLAGYLIGLARIGRGEKPPTEGGGPAPPVLDEPFPAQPPASRPG